MELLRSIVTGSARLLLAPFAGVHALWSLIPIGVLLGLAMLWAFGRLSNQPAIRATKRRLQARLYEFRLFVDEPRLIWQAQAELLRDNLRYIGLMLAPTAILAVPTLLLIDHLNAFYELAPLQPGNSADITVQLKRPIEIHDSPAMLAAPDGFIVETPPIRVVAKQQISWRIRPVRPSSGILRVTALGETATKSISAGRAPQYLSRRRGSSNLDVFWHPAEPRLSSDAIAWIEVDYPDASIDLLGVKWNWIVWLLIISMATALLLKRVFDVSF